MHGILEPPIIIKPTNSFFNRSITSSVASSRDQIEHISRESDHETGTTISCSAAITVTPFFLEQSQDQENSAEDGEWEIAEIIGKKRK